jgi:C4-dicarboxylate transporter, DctM subunit
MDIVVVSLIALVVLLIIMMVGIPVPISIGFCAVIGIMLTLGAPGLSKLSFIPYIQFFDMSWAPLVLFTLLAYILDETQIAGDVFKAANNWLSRLPGGLAVAAVWAEGVMAAAIGSSTITAIAIGKISVPQMEKMGYDKGFSLGAVLGGGVLGPLIPPSIPFITYAIIAQVSIVKLFIAGIIPGIILMVMFTIYIITACKIRPNLAPKALSVSWKERFYSLRKVWAIGVIILGIMGGIYFGIMTATEAAGVAVVLALILSVVAYRFRVKNLFHAMMEGAITNGMICFMVIAVLILSYLVGSSGMARILTAYLVSLNVSPILVIIIIMIILLILGCFMDSLTMILITLPFFVPLVQGLGFSLIWFGVLLVVNAEIGLLTPPMGLNLFIMRQVFDIPIGRLIRSATPFIVVLIVFLFVLVAVPEIALWLPATMK